MLAAIELLESHLQARFNQAVLRLGLEDDVDVEDDDVDNGARRAVAAL